MGSAQLQIPVVLMVSGGSDSEAMLELVVEWAHHSPDARSQGRSALADGIARMFAEAIPSCASASLHVLHVNHMLRGADADADETFVRTRCEQLGLPCTVRRVDVAQAARVKGGGLEACARELRYQVAGQLLDELCAQAKVDASCGLLLTAHTLDDRVETFFMRSLVGTGPGGLASIPRARGRIRRPLLDASREQLREWLRNAHPNTPDAELWREDATNDDGSNFRSRVRCELMPQLKKLRPGFERALARTMDLIAQEDETCQQRAESTVYRNLVWDGARACLPVCVLTQSDRPHARRVLRCALLVVDPDARLESAQIERILDNAKRPGFATEASGGIRVRIEGDTVVCRKVDR